MAALSREEALEKLATFMKSPEVLVNRPIEGADLITSHIVTAEYLAELASQKLDPTDVFIVSYPKAGTTWTQNIVKLIRSGGVKDGVELQRSIPWIEGNTDKNHYPPQIDLDSMPKPRAFKSHMTYDTMPCGKPNTTPSRYIYVARNPKDVAVSFYFHLVRWYVTDTTLDWDLFFRNFIYGNIEGGDFFDHVLSWWSHRNDDNVLFVTFEDMKKDLPRAIVRIAKFIGMDLSDEIVAKIATETSFSSMKNDSSANFTFMSHTFTPGSTPFMRKGEVGDWKNYFTSDQSAEMDKICRERLEGTGLKFDFGDSK